MTALGVLGSYALEGRGASYERARRLIAAGFPFVWDSGAWSVFTGLIAAEPDDDRLLRAAIDAHERFARWATALHDRPVFIYLAGAVSSDILLDRLPEGARS